MMVIPVRLLAGKDSQPVQVRHACRQHAEKSFARGHRETVPEAPAGHHVSLKMHALVCLDDPRPGFSRLIGGAVVALAAPSQIRASTKSAGDSRRYTGPRLREGFQEIFSTT